MESARFLVAAVLFFPFPCAEAQAAEHPVPLGKSPDAAACKECHPDKGKGRHVHTAIAMGCTICHAVTNEKSGTFINLVSPANELCFTCHAKSREKVLHGPYAQGNCMFCHSPHASDWPNQMLAQCSTCAWDVTSAPA